MKMGMQ